MPSTLDVHIPGLDNLDPVDPAIYDPPDISGFTNLADAYKGLGAGDAGRYGDIAGARNQWWANANDFQKQAVRNQFYGGQDPNWGNSDALELQSRRNVDAANQRANQPAPAPTPAPAAQSYGNLADFDRIAAEYGKLGQGNLEGFNNLAAERNRWWASASDDKRREAAAKHYGGATPDFEAMDATERKNRAQSGWVAGPPRLDAPPSQPPVADQREINDDIAGFDALATRYGQLAANDPDAYKALAAERNRWWMNASDAQRQAVIRKYYPQYYKRGSSTKKGFEPGQPDPNIVTPDSYDNPNWDDMDNAEIQKRTAARGPENFDSSFDILAGMYKTLAPNDLDGFMRLKAARDQWWAAATPEEKRKAVQKHYGGNMPNFAALDELEIMKRRAAAGTGSTGPTTPSVLGNISVRSPRRIGRGGRAYRRMFARNV